MTEAVKRGRGRPRLAEQTEIMQVRMPCSLADTLRAVADARGTTVSNMIREWASTASEAHRYEQAWLSGQVRSPNA